jgi:hypothetical protein
MIRPGNARLVWRFGEGQQRRRIFQAGGYRRGTGWWSQPEGNRIPSHCEGSRELMNIAELGGFLYLLLLFPPLIYLQRFLQREIQSIFLLITRQADISTALFSLLFLPGVLLHETSHYLMAHLLGVKTGRFSLIPKKVEDGRLQLGYVETAKTDFVRDALIGAAHNRRLYRSR